MDTTETLQKQSMEIAEEGHAGWGDTMAMAVQEIKQLRHELLMVAKVAADEPMFFNPMQAGIAKSIRDRVLRNSSEYE